jgi:hypothetical protein
MAPTKAKAKAKKATATKTNGISKTSIVLSLLKRPCHQRLEFHVKRSI